ncbi:MAG: carboxypeptidase-like regulatory domain-containing protein [Flavobacteriaceae bacterium]|nr:carboxypeptidase-like regulatory domain-containing protein [Flavobacteriaceae bacterium]
MKKIKNWLVVGLFMMTVTAFAQTKISGNVVDDTNQPLPGATVLVVGTTNGTTTDFDGNFSFTTTKQQGTVKVSYVGFKTRVLKFNGRKNFGTIKLEPSAESLDEVIITATSFAIDRKTPVAVSTIKAADIGVKLGNQEFPEILKSTPGVYATKGKGGGFGDSRINLRGFSSENIAVMINGVPVNDMENGKVYWSNWSGLSDVTSAMQVQRGLGASKVAVPSMGGTINIITKSIDSKAGGSIKTSIGNDGFFKYGMTYSTGLSDNGFAVTVSANKVSGNGYIDGTKFDGFNYFINISKRFNDSHKLSFTGFGASQKHGGRYGKKTIEFYRKSKDPKRFSLTWGYRNGQIESNSENFYHKPQLSLNHDWTISDDALLTTALYASFGSGGIKYNGYNKEAKDNKERVDRFRLGGEYEPIDFDKVVEENIANGAKGSKSIFLGNMNSHKWYGLLSTLKYDISERFTFMGGIDARYYEGYHYQEVNDLLGGLYYLNPEAKEEKRLLRKGDRFGQDYIGYVKRGGIFTQLEYSNGDLSAFLSSSLSNTNYQREEVLFKEGKSESKDFIGFGNKAGLNYNLNEYHNVFANIGYLSNAPFFKGSVFTNVKTSNELNKNAVNEKVFSVELGYGLKTEFLSANLNVYRTSWLDKSKVKSVDSQGERQFINLEGIDALHQGIELDFVCHLSEQLKLTGMASLGDWTWQSDVKGTLRDDTGKIIDKVEINGKGLKVSDAAQTTFALGMSYEPIKKTKFFIDYNFAGDNYAYFNIDSKTSANEKIDSWKIPNYHLFDLGFRHGFKIGSLNATINGKLNNIFDTEYISDATDGKSHTAKDAAVYYGTGRTFSLGLKVKF